MTGTRRRSQAPCQEVLVLDASRDSAPSSPAVDGFQRAWNANRSPPGLCPDSGSFSHRKGTSSSSPICVSAAHLFLMEKALWKAPRIYDEIFISLGCIF